MRNILSTTSWWRFMRIDQYIILDTRKHTYCIAYIHVLLVTRGIVEPLLKDTPELRTPLSKDTSVYVPSE